MFTIFTLLALGSLEPAAAQYVRLKVPLTVRDRSGHEDVIFFGVDPSATECLDPGLGELALPDNPCGTAPECMYFVDSRDDSNRCLGAGVLLDLRQYRDPVQVDTYRVAFSVQEYPITFSWPPDLSEYYSGLSLASYPGGGPGVLSMLQTDSMTLETPVSGQLQLIASGPRGVTDGVAGHSGMPDHFFLEQNFPNPFNPSTTIGYEIPVTSNVSLSVYNVFGEQVATLRSGLMGPGRYEEHWDASGVSSGVYYCRIKTRGYLSTRKMIVLH